ncbi:hypothetical protein IGI67_003314 [Enterococcus sp. AZ196]
MQICIMFFFILLLTLVIRSQLVNNVAWLEGKWTNPEHEIEFKTSKIKNEKYRTWSISDREVQLIKNVRVSVISKKNNIILSDDGNRSNYIVIRLDKDRIKLNIVENGAVIKEEILEK